MGKIGIFIGLFFLFNLGFGQNFDSKSLNEKISKLNNELNYAESIVILEEIINKSSSSNYEKYTAYLLKALTYKRIYNYTEVLRNLDQALKWGLQTPQKEEVEGRIKIEKLFIQFDMLKFDEVKNTLASITKENEASVDVQTRAFYISLLAVLDIQDKKYKEAEEKLDSSIILLNKNYQKDLPNIYRKKIALYSKLNNEQKAEEAYKLGLMVSEKFNIGVYKVAMHEAMEQFYLDHENYRLAYYYQNQREKELNEYNVKDEADKLKILEMDLLKNRTDLELKYKRNILFFMIFLVIILLAFLLVLFKLLKSNKQKRIFVERENARMRFELEDLTKEINEKGESKLDLNSFNLTQRQIEIINLVKQGKTNKEIGAELFISENTVKYHLKIIYNALGIENRWDLQD